MNTAELDYSLPDELIAQQPADQRDASRLLVLDRAQQTMEIDTYANVAQYLNPGDCMVLNNTRVIRARLKGHKATGGKVEIFLLHEDGPGEWTALVRPSAKVKPGTEVMLGEGIAVTVQEVLPEGRRKVQFATPDVLSLLEARGELPLPPYIERKAGHSPSDLRRYQTVYAAQPGAVAAPTAGLHFTDEVFASLDAKGVGRAALTLHVGYGTFKPVTTDDLKDHYVEPEDFEFPDATAQALNQCREDGGRVVAVGTTATRVLETQCKDRIFQPGQGQTDAYIYPPYTFQGVDVLQTNFHLPKSSLLALVCAFGGTEFMLEAYKFAVAEKFRFYSYGDVMLIL